MKKLPYGPKWTGSAPLSVGRKRKKITGLVDWDVSCRTKMCPVLFHKTWTHETESKPKYWIVLRSMAQLKAGWCLPAAYTPCTQPWIGDPDWPHPKCPHVQWVNPFQTVFFFHVRKQLSQVFITLPCPLIERMLWALCTGQMLGCSFFSQMKELQHLSSSGVVMLHQSLIDPETCTVL